MSKKNGDEIICFDPAAFDWGELRPGESVIEVGQPKKIDSGHYEIPVTVRIPNPPLRCFLITGIGGKKRKAQGTANETKTDEGRGHRISGIGPRRRLHQGCLRQLHRGDRQVTSTIPPINLDAPIGPYLNGTSARLRNCLDSASKRTLRSVLAMQEHELLAIRSFGKTNLRELKRRLSDMGLALGQELPTALIPTAPICLNCGKKMVLVMRAQARVDGHYQTIAPWREAEMADLNFLWCACGATRIVVNDPDGSLRKLWEQENNP